MDLVTKVDVESFLNKWLRTRNLSFLSLGIGIFSSSVSNLAICCLSNNFLESIVIALYFPVAQRDPHLVSLLDYCNNGFICRRSSSSLYQMRLKKVDLTRRIHEGMYYLIMHVAN